MLENNLSKNCRRSSVCALLCLFNHVIDFQTDLPSFRNTITLCPVGLHFLFTGFNNWIIFNFRGSLFLPWIIYKVLSLIKLILSKSSSKCMLRPVFLYSPGIIIFILIIHIWICEIYQNYWKGLFWLHLVFLQYLFYTVDFRRMWPTLLNLDD